MKRFKDRFRAIDGGKSHGVVWGSRNGRAGFYFELVGRVTPTALRDPLATPSQSGIQSMDFNFSCKSQPFLQTKPKHIQISDIPPAS
jgi:hypothetical protein